MLNIKLSLLAMVGFAALTVASASAMPVSSLSQIAQSDVQDARVVCNSRGRCYRTGSGKITPWRKVATTVKVGFASSVLAPVAAATMPTTMSVSDQRHEESDTRVPRRPARLGAHRAVPGARAGAACGSMVTYSTASQSRAASSRSEEMASTPAGGSPSRWRRIAANPGRAGALHVVVDLVAHVQRLARAPRPRSRARARTRAGSASARPPRPR